MIPTLPCGDDADPCCTALYDIANNLLTEVFDAVSTCAPVENCPPVAAYVTLGNADDGIADALTVAIRSIDPSPSTRTGSFGLWRVVYVVALRESGWPTARVENDAIVLPSPTEQAIAAQHVLAMGETMHRRLTYMAMHRGLAPVGTGCTNGTVGSLRPLNPQGGVVGWEIPVTVDLPWN